METIVGALVVLVIVCGTAAMVLARKARKASGQTAAQPATRAQDEPKQARPDRRAKE